MVSLLLWIVLIFLALLIYDTHLILITQREKEVCFRLIYSYLCGFFSQQQKHVILKGVKNDFIRLSKMGP